MNSPMNSVHRSDSYANYEPWNAIEGSNDHPALVAWRQLYPNDNAHVTIESGQAEGKATIYRLHGALPSGATVIAKHGIRETVLIEHRIYTELLPHLPISPLQCYGMVCELDAQYCWLFLEDVSGTVYTPADAQHRALAGEWLGLLHSSAASLSAVHQLPEHGPSWYLQQLSALRDTLLHNEHNPALSHNDRDILRAVVLHCDHLEHQWDQIESLCAVMPRTLIHGDFGGRNIRVQRSHMCRLAVFDWEMAGWGVPATDVTYDPIGDALVYPGLSALPDLDAYHATVREAWPELTMADIRRWAAIGLVFRLLLAWNWASMSLPYPDIAGGIVYVMGLGQRMMLAALRTAGLDVPRRG